MINYIDTKNRNTENLKIMKKRSFLYAMMRMSSMILTILFVWLAQREAMFYFFSITCLVLFLILVWVHEKLKGQMLFKETKNDMIVALEKRQNDDWKQEAKDMVYSDDTNLADLDISGKDSLIDYIRMAQTPFGKEYLLSLFENNDDFDQIIKRQEAVKEMLQQPEVLLNLQTHSALFANHSKKIKKNIIADLIQHAGEPMKESNILYLLHVVMVSITIVLMIVCFFSVPWVHILWIMISLNIILVLLFFTQNQLALQEVAQVKDMLEDYVDIMNYFSSIHVKSTYFINLQEENENALKGIEKLLKIANLTRIRANFVTNLLFNGLFQLDFHCMHELTAWKKQYGKDLKNWFYLVAKMEAITSLCVIGQVKDTYCFPDIVISKKPNISFQDAQHPLISESKAVKNSLLVENETYIITGSNMSGKTTFLRTIGVNAKLALAGAPVCAHRFQMSKMDVYTSMRIKDDVKEGISTFYAELLSIKQMMDAAKLEKPMMVLIDEIFKGTNSADRIMCAQEAIVRLHQPWIATMVSTHDFELCSLEHDTSIHAHNFHFEEHYVDNEIRFDYTLKKGKCTTTNARQLMKLAGF